MAQFYGIDLGTTYSCISFIDSEEENPTPHVIQNEKTQMAVIPSVVYIDNDGNIVVGERAKARLGVEPENSVAFIKREMSVPDFKRTLRGKEYTPEEISSMILKFLVDMANEQRCKSDKNAKPIYDVVITKPAYFAELESRRTKKAGELAGLNVIGLLAEPTSAALSYGQGQPDDKTLLVYDLGGGTFDVTILRFRDKVADVLSTDGNHKLGGEDWDRALVDFALNEVHGTFNELSLNDQNKLMKEAEKAKIELSDAEDYLISFTYKGSQDVMITRNQFDDITWELLDQTKSLTKSALKKADFTADNIDEVLLVGGSTHMPQVMSMVKEMFPNSKVEQVDPALAVAKGAAYYALQESVEVGTNGESGGQVIRLGNDRNPHSYGIKAYNPNNEIRIYYLIRSNDLLEIEREFDDFVTHDEGQTSVELHFYQGQSQQYEVELNKGTEIFAEGNENGKNPQKQVVSWGKPVPKGSPIQYKVSRDKNGIVKVFVECYGAHGEFKLGLPTSKSTDTMKR